MEIHQAVEQIDSIWQQLGQVQTFRGYRATTVATTGVLGFGAGAWQAAFIPDPLAQVDAYLSLWVGVATTCSLLVGWELVGRYWRSTRLEKSTMRRAVEQFLPCLVLGAGLTWLMGEVAVNQIWMLPGLWSLLFSLGVFASAQQVTPAVNWVALYYALAGFACLAWARGEFACSPWAMVLPFGVGQLLMGLVLYRYVELDHAS